MIKRLAGIIDSDILIERGEVVGHKLQLIKRISVDVDTGTVRTNARELRSLLFSSRYRVLSFSRVPKQAQREQAYQGSNRE